jgi:hypothetical protein
VPELRLCSTAGEKESSALGWALVILSMRQEVFQLV